MSDWLRQQHRGLLRECLHTTPLCAKSYNAKSLYAPQLWAPPEPDSVVGDTEGEMVAWCTRPGRVSRHFLVTLSRACLANCLSIVARAHVSSHLEHLKVSNSQELHLTFK